MTLPLPPAAGLFGGRVVRLIDRTYPSLRIPAFRVLWLSLLPATFGWQMGTVAISYTALKLSDSAATLGLISAAIGLPMLVFSLVGGVAADRLPRRLVLLGSQTLMLVSATALAALALTGRLEVWHLLALSLLQGTAFSFNMPARQAYIGELVGPEHLRNAVALNNAGLNFSRVGGPALAGVLLATPWIGAGGLFLLMACLVVGVIVALLRLPEAGNGSTATVSRRGGWADLVEGLRYLKGSPALIILMAGAVVAVCLGMPYQQLMPVFSERVFAVGATGLGLLSAASGLGALIGSLAVGLGKSVRRPGRLQTAIGLGFGACLVGFALAPQYELAVLLLVGVGAFSSAYSTLNSTLIMGVTDPRFHGRVMSVYLMTFAVQPLGAMPLAWLAEHAGGRLAVGFSGLAVAVTMLAIGAWAGGRLNPPAARA